MSTGAAKLSAERAKKTWFEAARGTAAASSRREVGVEHLRLRPALEVDVVVENTKHATPVHGSTAYRRGERDENSERDRRSLTGSTFTRSLTKAVRVHGRDSTRGAGDSCCRVGIN